jgi:hypothetical protein
MKQFRYIATVALLCVLLLSLPAYGYVDPNAAGAISQILTPLLILGAAALTFLRKQVGAVIASISRRLRRSADA